MDKSLEHDNDFMIINVMLYCMHAVFVNQTREVSRAIDQKSNMLTMLLVLRDCAQSRAASSRSPHQKRPKADTGEDRCRAAQRGFKPAESTSYAAKREQREAAKRDERVRGRCEEGEPNGDHLSLFLTISTCLLSRALASSNRRKVWSETLKLGSLTRGHSPFILWIGQRWAWARAGVCGRVGAWAQARCALGTTTDAFTSF
eukprot:3583298-Pleurochrysis_carterae.AAC.6